MRQPGQLVVMNATDGGFTSKAQRFFTGQPYTHVGLLIYPIYGQDAFFSADLTVDITPTKHLFENNEAMMYQMYYPSAWTQDEIDRAWGRAYDRFAGEIYGFMQWPWFVYRYIMAKFGKDVRKEHNWFPDHVVCSEVGWWAMWYLYEERPDLYAFANKLNEWRPDTFSAGDCYTVISSFPELFALTEERWTGPK